MSSKATKIPSLSLATTGSGTILKGSEDPASGKKGGVYTGIGGKRGFGAGGGGVSGFFFGKGMGNPMFFLVDDSELDKPKSASASDEEVEAAARAQAELLRRRRGRQSTIITGPLGDTSQSRTQKTTLG